MPITRVPLGRGAAPKSATDWLRARHGQGRRLDLRGLVVATPGSRAGRRLAEVLAESGGVVALPSPSTPGGLPEKLLVIERPVAGDLQAVLARVAALRAAPKRDFAALFPSFASESRDALAWFQLGTELQELYATLSAACLTFAEVVERVRGVADPAPWKFLGRVQSEYERLLASGGVVDRHAARLEALAAGRFRSDCDLVLVATADLPPIARRCVEGFAASRGVTALVHAAESELELFDALGCFIPQKWLEKQVAVPDEALLVAERPRDQAAALLRSLASLGSVAADAITVGVGNEADLPLIERELGFAGVAARPATGRPLTLSRPGLLLAALADLLASRSFDSLAALVRHPDVESFLALTSKPRRSAAALLDDYRSLVVPRSLDNGWVDPPGRDGKRNPAGTRLKEALAPLLALVPPDAEKPRPLGRWSEPMLQLLAAVYGATTLDPETAESLESLLALVRESAVLSGPPSEFATDLPSALAILLDRAGRMETPRPASGAAIELLGWLELPMDDAEHLVIVGFNEGAIPGRVGEDPFLSAQVRAALGLPGREERLARDIMVLDSILSSRRRVTFIAGRRTEEGEPLAPSRLLLLGSEVEVARRLDRFFKKVEPPAPPLFEPSGLLELRIPFPKATEDRIEKLSVTGFKRFLACPYMFYLERVLGLATVTEPAPEIEQRDFGTIIHEILARFGRDEKARRLTDAAAIEAFLAEALEQSMRARYGKRPRTMVKLQASMIRRRLAAFAKWQAAEAAAGWVIHDVELDLEFTRMVDGSPFLIYGRVDRIDRKGDAYRVLDYKTSTSAKTPERTHRVKADDGSRAWVDLQLPLYRHLAGEKLESTEIRLGYVNLPSKTSETGVEMAEWSEEELASADEKAAEVIRALRSQFYWPPAQVRDADAAELDAFGRISMDAYIGRESVIQFSTRHEIIYYSSLDGAPADDEEAPHEGEPS